MKPNNKFHQIMPLVVIVSVLLNACSFQTPSKAKPAKDKATAIQAERIGDNYVRYFNWTYAGEHYSLTVKLPVATVEYYRNLHRDQPVEDFMFEHPDYPYVEDIGEALYKQIEFKDYSEKQVAEYLLAFVQSIPYVDIDYQYRHYMIETLVADSDCDNKSQALATLYSFFGIRSALIMIPGHMLVGVSCAECSGYYYLENGEKFYLAETTSDHAIIGRKNSLCENLKATLTIVEIPDSPKPELLYEEQALSWEKSPTGYKINIRSDEVRPDVDVLVNGRSMSLGFEGTPDDGSEDWEGTPDDGPTNPNEEETIED